ncbi:MAG: hypothetical protein M1816_002779 [Peltula sp. TS41687]|nr:MAG: hypothetical protein M1816_002779 [Peltula sp. TS41687]
MNLLKGSAHTVMQVLNWFMPLDKSGDEPGCKMYARLELGFSKTYSTITFAPHQIHEMDNEFGDDIPEENQFNDAADELGWNSFAESCKKQRVMNDGCARMSVAAANELWRDRGELGPVLSVFQGRIANAKGLWVRSPDLEKDARDPTWIETTKSQREFHRHDQDKDEATFDKQRMTFELLDWSKPPSCSQLSISLLPILRDRGVPEESIAQFVRSQLQLERQQFFHALSDQPSLLAWISERFPVIEENDGSDSLQGSMPKSRSERISCLLRAGFRPDSCYYLSTLIMRGVRDWLG